MVANLSIKNVPDDVLEKLRERAKRNRRSLQGELMTILEQAVLAKRLTPDEVLKRVETLALTTSDDSVRTIRGRRDAR